MIEQDLRDRILSAPEAILEDKDVMRALVAANERAMGANIVDLRGIAMERLEGRLDRLEGTHRSVLAAAYENVAGTNQVHRAVLRLLDPPSFDAFLERLTSDVAETLRVDHVRLVLESAQEDRDPALRSLGAVLFVAKPGFIASYVAAGRDQPPRPVTLRKVASASDSLYGEAAVDVRSEALMLLDLGAGRLPGMLALGANDPGQFRAAHGTDLLAFFAGVFERTMRRWLS